MGIDKLLREQFDIYNDNPQIIVQAYDDEPSLWIEFNDLVLLSALQGTIDIERKVYAGPKEIWKAIAPHIINQGLGWGEGDDYTSVDYIISQIPDPHCSFVRGGKPVLQIERENGNN